MRGTALVVLLVAGCAPAPALLPPKARAAQRIDWVGIDYTRTQMVAMDDFNKPAEIFPGYLDKWNTLFLKENLADLQTHLGKPIAVNVDAVMQHNHQASPKQIIRQLAPPGPNLSASDVAQMVKGYDLHAKDGVALVFIVDTLVKQTERGCLYPTYFDVATRDVIATGLVCYEASGFGFRNYWFHPIKEAAEHL